MAAVPGTSVADPDDPPGQVVDAQSAADASTAGQIARTYGHPVVIDPETSQTSTVSAMPDGTLQLTTSSDPVRVKWNGTWTPIDTTLSLGSDGMLAPAASAAPVEFSDGGTGPMARVQSPSGGWLTEIWPAGTLPVPSVQGSVAIYAEVFPGVDLRLTATVAGLDEVLVIKTAEAAANPDLDAVRIDVSGATAAPVAGTGNGTGAQAVNASDGLSSASPSWWDSTQPDSGPSGPGGLGLPRPLSEGVSASAIVLYVGAISGIANVSYPVYADPDWGVLARTFVDSAYPTQSYWNGANSNDGLQHVGFIDAAEADDGQNHTTRSFWRMDTHLLAGTYVKGATFNATETYSYSCTVSEVDLYQVGDISSSTTWNSGPAFYTYQDKANVAWGYSSACGPHSVGFNVKAAAQAAADGSSSYITLGMMAYHDTINQDKYSWKKFAAAATLVVDYDHYPTSPVGRTVTPCSFVCTQPIMTSAYHPVLTANSTDPDSNLLSYTFQIAVGHSANPTQIDAIHTTAVSYASGSMAYWTDDVHLPDGDYEYRVQANDGTVPGPWSTYVTFTVDTSVPSPPTLTESAGVSHTKDSFAGTVGVTPETVTMTPLTSDHDWGYAYAILPSGASVQFPSNLTCNTTVNGYTTVCPGSVNGPASVTVTVPDDQSTFSATAFDAAGNAPSTPSSVSFYALGDYTGTQTGDSYASDLGHSWATDSAGSSCPTGSPPPVTDTAAYGPSPGSEVDLTTLSGGACWTTDSTAPAISGQTIAPNGNGVLSFSGAAATATTSAAAIDTTKSFTVAAWLNPTHTSSTTYDTAISQDGSSLSSFFLQNSGGHWKFCVTNSSATTTYAGDCVSSPGGVSVNTWTYVAGVYNASDHQLLLYTSTSDSPGTASIASHLAGVLPSSGSVAFGRGRSSSAYSYWSGSILDPVLTQGVADTNQLKDFADLQAPSLITPPVIGS